MHLLIDKTETNRLLHLLITRHGKSTIRASNQLSFPLKISGKFPKSSSVFLIQPLFAAHFCHSILRPTRVSLPPFIKYFFIILWIKGRSGLLISCYCNFVRKSSEQSSMRRLTALIPAFLPNISTLVIEMTECTLTNLLLCALCPNWNARRSRLFSVWKLSARCFVFWYHNSTQQRSSGSF